MHGNVWSRGTNKRYSFSSKRFSLETLSDGREVGTHYYYSLQLSEECQSSSTTKSFQAQHRSRSYKLSLTNTRESAAPLLHGSISIAPKQKMDPLYAKAQRQLGGSTSSKGTSKKSRKKKRAPNTQSAGQPSAPGGTSFTSESSRSRPQVGGNIESSGGDEHLGGCKCHSCTIGALHAIDAGLGISCLVYGGMVHVAEVTVASISYGLVLLLGSLSGAAGYYSRSCNGCGFQASAVAGLLVGISYIAAFVGILVSWDSFITFLDDSYEELLLNEGSVRKINRLKVLFAIIFAVLACLEGYR